ncbi:RNA-directed DNA polymerase, eukaryota, nucleotide-binding alpha-beta plait domain protein [Tanacetum coccineum]
MPAVQADFFRKKSENAAVQAVYKKNCRLFPSDISLGKIPLKDKTLEVKSVEKSNSKGIFPSDTVRFAMVTHRSMEDHVIRISKSVFVTNFPDAYGSRDLWKLCETYGKVVDVFIPNRLSKAGKRFAFVRFIKVDDIDRLLSNLCTL